MTSLKLLLHLYFWYFFLGGKANFHSTGTLLLMVGEGEEPRLMGGGGLTSTMWNHPWSISFLINNTLTPSLRIKNGCDTITTVPNCAGGTAGRKRSLPFAKHWQNNKIFNRDPGWNWGFNASFLGKIGDSNASVLGKKRDFNGSFFGEEK